MSNAVRIDGKIVLKPRKGLTAHCDIFLDYIERMGISDDDADAMIDAGRVEWGQLVYVDGEVIFSHFPRKGANSWRYREYDKLKHIRTY